MKVFLTILFAAFLLIPGAFAQEKKLESKPSASGFENRCGWVNNPTPANWDLTDKDGVWLIGVQGGRQAEGDLPEFPENKNYWKKTNVHYGYGCACLMVRVDKKEKAVLEIKSGHPLPLAKCRADKSLPSESRN
jgi:uncharacterized protein DUF4087